MKRVYRKRTPAMAALVSERFAVRSFREVRDIIRERHGWTISVQRVQQICGVAEAKLRLALEACL